MTFTDIDIQTHTFDLTERHSLQPLVEHADTVLFTLNGFADDIGHTFRADRQFLFTGGQFVSQTGQFDFHLFDGIDRIIRFDNILTDTFAQMAVHFDKELYLAFRTLRIFGQTQRITQMLVIRHRLAQCPERFIRHRTQCIGIFIGQFTAVEAALNTTLFHHPHHGTPARFGGNHLFTDLLVIALRFTQAFLQVVHFRFPDPQLFFQLIDTGTVMADLIVQFITTHAGTLFRIGIRLNTNLAHFTLKFAQHV